MGSSDFRMKESFRLLSLNNFDDHSAHDGASTIFVVHLVDWAKRSDLDLLADLWNRLGYSRDNSVPSHGYDMSRYVGERCSLQRLVAQAPSRDSGFP
jgi:hypothetical protein